MRNVTAARALLFFRSRCLISREVASADGHGDDAITDSGGNRSRPARKQLLFRHGNLTRPVVTRFFSESCGCNKSDVRVLPPRVLSGYGQVLRTAGRFNRNMPYAPPSDIDSRRSGERNVKTNKRNYSCFRREKKREGERKREISGRALFDKTSSIATSVSLHIIISNPPITRDTYILNSFPSSYS